MNHYYYLSSYTSIVLSEKEKPEQSPDEYNLPFAKKAKKFERYLLTLPRIKVEGKVDWVNLQEVVEGKDFRFEDDYTKGTGAPILAIPIPTNDSTEGKEGDDFLNKMDAEMWHPQLYSKSEQLPVQGEGIFNEMTKEDIWRKWQSDKKFLIKCLQALQHYGITKYDEIDAVANVNPVTPSLSIGQTEVKKAADWLIERTFSQEKYSFDEVVNFLEEYANL